MQLIRAIRGLFRDRWQIPAAVVALVIAGLAISRIRPPERTIQFEPLLADVMKLMEAEAYYDAANAAANLLDLKPPLPARQQAILHDRIAEISCRVERRREKPDLDNVRLVLEHQKQAEELGLRPDARTALRAGQAQEWLGEFKDAAEEYRKALEREPSTAIRRESLQALVRLLEGRPGAEEERREAIDALLAEEGVAPAYVWWALQHAMQEAIDREEPLRARGMLERHAERFKRSDLRGYHDFLWAWLDISTGRIEEAAPLIESVDDWLREHTRVDSEMDRAGFLPAMNLWLHGRIHLAEDRPQQALDTLDRVLTLQSHGQLMVDVAIARAHALAMLERHAAARRAVRDVLMRLAGNPAALHGAMMRMRRTMLELSTARRRLEDSGNAVAYLALGLDLTPAAEAESRLELLELLGNECEQGAQRSADPVLVRQFTFEAGDYFGKAADLAIVDPGRHATLLWASAQSYDRAGDPAKARDQLRAFIESTSSDPRLAPAMLQLGQAYAADGMFEEAMTWYRRLAANFPNVEESLRARLLRADALVMSGESRYDEAEQVLSELLTDDRLSPSNQNYKDALFMLSDLLYERGRYAQAISRLEEFLTLAQGHAEYDTSRFTLADAYRRSAHTLRESPPAGAPADAVRAESDQRFRRAAELFQEFAPDEPESAGEDAEQETEQQTLRRLALLNRAECLYELNQPDTLDAALAVYRQAAAVYQGRRTALVAQVQIVNILLRQGKLTEAARAIEQARWLLKSVPDEEFAETVGEQRSSWEQYFNAVASSPLLRGVFADAR
ncbi:MAG: tetratricopeptide repeat protein [Planctomycetes bacterium]|nr:tetratricopeptide repeat protein [Planctomycetota bacterium]